MAWTQSSGTNAYSETQVLTRTVPTTDATEGAPLNDASAVTLVIEANSTKVFSGGTMRGYLYDDAVAAWVPCPELDQTISATTRRAAYNYVVSGARKASRVQFVTDSVTVSGGTDIVVYILVSPKAGR